MKTFYVTFWNVQNLFTPGSVKRGPQTQNELDRKIETLAKILNRIGTNGPDLIGLAEIESDVLFEKLYNQLTETYLHHWEPCSRTGNTGLGILA